MRKSCLIIVLSSIWFGFAINATLKADWPQFRGNNSDGHGTGSPPVEFGPTKNRKWTTPLDPGHSSPCISGEQIFVTTYDEKSRALGIVSLNRDNGDVLWKKSIKVETFEKGHPSFNPASCSPCCDDQRVVAYFGSYGLICFDFDGELLWERRLPLAKSFAGNATSPMITGDKVILYRGNYVDHYLLCLDKKTGEEIWRIEQDEQFTGEMACTSCPIVAGDKLICHSARSVQAFDIDTGDVIWIAKCATTATSTPVLVGGEVLVAAWNKLGEPDLRPPFPSFDQLVKQHDKDDDGLISKTEFPRLWIFHRPDGAEAPQNGAPVSFQHADKNHNGKIESEEWAQTIRELESFRAGYDTHGLLAIPVNSNGLVTADAVRTLTTQGIPEVPSPVSDAEEGVLMPVYAPNAMPMTTSGSKPVLLISMVADNNRERFPYPLDDPRSVLSLLVGPWKRIEIFCSPHVAQNYPLIEMLENSRGELSTER